MTIFPRIDMGEVTRLTRAGRLDEAMALLQGRARPAGTGTTDAKTDAKSDAKTAATLDMVAPSGLGGAWTAPEAPPEAAPAPTGGADVPPGGVRGRSGLLRGLGERFAKAGAAHRAMPVPEGARFGARVFANAAGERAYKLYLPSSADGRALPVVVMLHGCTQSPDDFAAGTGMNALAEERKFLVVYPAQSRAANAQLCWNWFNPADQRREGGEPALIAGLVREVVAEFRADPSRVYVAGLSAGGAAAAVLAATHPDLFAAVGIHSGLPCGAARDLPSAFAAMKGGAPSAPRGTRPSHAVPTIVFHGDADRTVHASNAERIVAQAAEADAEVVVSGGTSPAGMRYTRSVRCDASGRPVLEQWSLHGAGHAWSGGSPAGSYTDPRGPDASREMVRFFLAHANAGHPARP